MKLIAKISKTQKLLPQMLNNHLLLIGTLRANLACNLPSSSSVCQRYQRVCPSGFTNRQQTVVNKREGWPLDTNDSEEGIG